MIQLSIIYNYVADRRKQGLDFVGKERRSITLDTQQQKALEENNKKFLNDVRDIEDIEQLA